MVKRKKKKLCWKHPKSKCQSSGCPAVQMHLEFRVFFKTDLDLFFLNHGENILFRNGRMASCRKCGARSGSSNKGKQLCCSSKLHFFLQQIFSCPFKQAGKHWHHHPHTHAGIQSNPSFLCAKLVLNQKLQYSYSNALNCLFVNLLSIGILFNYLHFKIYASCLV